MRIVFMGTPEFAVPSLKILIENHYQIAAVVTSLDKPQGRGQKLGSSAIKNTAIKYNLPVFQPQSLKDENFLAHLRKINPDLIIIVAFKILPREVFEIPKYGSINLHASLLPKYRGAAPINWAIIKGEKETGVTTFFLQEKVDTGDIILQTQVPIGENETAGELHDRLAEIGAELVLKTVNLIKCGNVTLKKQDESIATPAPKILKDNCKIDWNRTSVQIHNFIRGLSPIPCAYTIHKGKIIKIYRTKLTDTSKSIPPGVIEKSSKKLFVGTYDGVIEIVELQQEGKRRLSSEEFLKGYLLTTNDKFE